MDSSLSIVWRRADVDQVLQVLGPQTPFNGLTLTTATTARSSGGSDSKGRKGPRLSALVEQAMAGLTAEDRSRIDLVILKGEGKGEGDRRQVWIPRSYVSKGPLVVVQSESRFKTVLPADPRPGPAAAELPLAAFEIENLTRVELANYQERLAGLLLQRRTDPAAMRGEKLFIQNCMACHSDSSAKWKGLGGALAQTLGAGIQKHVTAPGVRPLDDRSSRALVSYWNAWLSEQTSNR